MTLIRRLEYKCKPPIGWGLVRHDFLHAQVVLAPIPLNLLFRATLWLYWTLVKGFCRVRWEQELGMAWREGYEQAVLDNRGQPFTPPPSRSDGSRPA